MIAWDEFSAREPSLAEAGEKQLFQYGVGLAFLATLRKDGAPRLHPVCPVLSGGQLFVLITPDSPKRGDLLRDGRYALQAFPQDKPDSDEFYVAGRAKAVADPEIFQQVLRDAKHHASPEEILFELQVDRVMHTTWEGFGTPEYRPIHVKWRYSPD